VHRQYLRDRAFLHKILEMPQRTNQSTAKAWLRALELTAPIASHPNRILPVVIDELANKFDGAPALLSESECLTYRDLATRSEQYAYWALEQGVAKGDTVCLFMPNRAEYFAIWIGITSVGGVVALLNTNLTGRSLAHCVNTVEPRHIIVAAPLLDAFLSAQPYLVSDAKTWLHGDGPAKFPRIELDGYSSQRFADVDRRPVTINDLALYIYTSGTTGLPKAAKVSHYRVMQWSLWFAGMMGTRSSDRMYDCLPMYHSIGGVVAIGAVLANGGSVIIREKFSARNFWDDVINSDSNILASFVATSSKCLRIRARPVTGFDYVAEMDLGRMYGAISVTDFEFRKSWNFMRQLKVTSRFTTLEASQVRLVKFRVFSNIDTLWCC
jgi:fatty-acyl-CoA synthase